jgi:hypothetical protein
MEVSGQLDTPIALPPGKSLRYSLNRRLGGPKSRSGRGGEENNPSASRGSSPSSPAPLPVIFLTELFRFTVTIDGGGGDSDDSTNRGRRPRFEAWRISSSPPHLRRLWEAPTLPSLGVNRPQREAHYSM